MDSIDLVGWPAEQTLRVTGAPNSLRVPVVLQNRSDTTLEAGQAPLVALRSESGEALPIRSVSAVPGVTAGDTTSGRLRLRLDPLTPPGRYDGRIVVAGLARSLRIEIVETIDLSVRPSPLIVDVAAAKRATVSVENRGNVALTIDVNGDYPLGEELPLLEGGVVPDAPDGIGRLFALLPSAPRRVPALREVGTIGIAMPDGGFRIEPGNAATFPIDLTLPDTLSPTVRYRALVPIYGEDLAITIITAAKSKPLPTPRPRKRNNGETS